MFINHEHRLGWQNLVLVLWRVGDGLSVHVFGGGGSRRRIHVAGWGLDGRRMADIAAREKVKIFFSRLVRLFHVLLRAHPEMRLEGAAEVLRRGIAAGGGDFLGGECPFMEKGGCLLHPRVRDVPLAFSIAALRASLPVAES